VAHVVVGESLDAAEPHGQHRLGAVERLNLALLVDAQHHRVIGRVQVETDNVANLLNEEGVRGEFEMLLPMRLNPERLPDTLDGGLRQPRLGGNRPAAPMRSVLGLRLERLPDQGSNPFVLDRPGTTEALAVVQSHNALLRKSSAPDGDHGPAEAHQLCDLVVGLPLGRQKNQTSPLHQGVRQRSRSRDRLELRAGLVTQRNRNGTWTSWHSSPPLVPREDICPKYTVKLTMERYTRNGLL